MAKSGEMGPALNAFLVLTPVVVAAALVLSFLIPGNLRRGLIYVVLILALLQMGSFEWLREAGRRPFLIYGHTYSNSIAVADAEKLNAEGVLASAKWVQNKTVNQGNRLEAGRELFTLECRSCHSVGGPMLNIMPRTAKFSTFGLDAQINGMGKMIPYMPQFVGTRPEREALAAYVAEDLHGRGLDKPYRQTGS